MKRVLVKIIIPACLIVSVAIIIAGNTTDYFIQNDLATSESVVSDGLAASNQQHIDRLLEEGYSPEPTIMSAVTDSQTAADTVSAIIHSRREYP
mgnify:CR=1 FL=1|jgi:hypothetical protein|tara:strand:+ start:258 stop:539 length:282 start_codon:yes stop_codon:yes gene_type:complete